jgi:hypothetical protein
MSAKDAQQHGEQRGGDRQEEGQADDLPTARAAEKAAVVFKGPARRLAFGAQALEYRDDEWVHEQPKKDGKTGQQEQQRGEPFTMS